MPISVPKFIKQAWAAVGTKADIPDSADPTTGRAGFDQGFPPINMTPVAAGGIPPFGQDMNGVLYDLSSAIQYVQAGRSFPFNQEFATAIGGYGKGALVTSASDQSILYRSKIDSNTIAPPSANWELASTIPQATEAVIGGAKIASIATAAAFLNNTDIITPARLASALGLRVGHTFTGNDWAPMPGGLIVQWGTQSLSGTSVVNITLPITFPNAFLNAQSNNGTNSSNANAGHRAIRISNSQIGLQTNNTSMLIDWIAIGY